MSSKNYDDLNFAYSLYCAMQKDNLGYIYRGRFDQNITDNILSLSENKLEKEEQSSKIKKRVYSILVECLQNITRHQDDAKDETTHGLGLFVLQKKEENYYITTGNLIENTNIETIKKLIEKINGLEKDELKQYYKEVLEEGSLSDKGGAGLGLIDMARKSGNKLLYEFRPVGPHYSYFYLHTIPSLEENKSIQASSESIENIIEIHQTLNSENIFLVFNGSFNQESLMVLLASLEGQMSGNASLKKKVFYTVVEMLQNIVKHGANPNNLPQGNPGIFLIGEQENKYFIITGNYLPKERTAELKEKLKSVNNLTKEQLDNYYNQCLFDFEIDDSKKAGLGIIDLRIKSGCNLIYNFHEESDYSFFSLEATINNG